MQTDQIAKLEHGPQCNCNHPDCDAVSAAEHSLIDAINTLKLPNKIAITAALYLVAGIAKQIGLESKENRIQAGANVLEALEQILTQEYFKDYPQDKTAALAAGLAKVLGMQVIHIDLTKDTK